MQLREKIIRLNRAYLTAIVFLSAVGIGVLSVTEALTPGRLTGILVAQQIVITLPFFRVAGKDAKSLKEQIHFHRVSGRTMVATLFVAIGIREVDTVLDVLSRTFAPSGTEAVGEIVQNIPLPVSIVVIGLIPALGEEFVYRGMMFTTYKRASRRKGILLSSLLFALMHMNVNQFSYTFVMGLVMALLMEKTDSIIPTILVHGLNNATAVCIGEMPRCVQRIMMPQSVGEMGLRAAAGLLLIAVALKRIDETPMADTEENEPVWTASLFVSVAVLGLIVIQSLFR